MTRRDWMLAASAGSLALLLGAFIFQWLGYAPCKMCLWQRWPHGAAIGFGALTLAFGPLLVFALGGAVSALTTSGIGIYHTGVERAWWEGPTSCSGGGGGLTGLSGNDLLSLDAPLNVVMCDEVAWAFVGLSMATWNALLSFLLALLWISAMARR